MNSPLVSICCITYNHSLFIHECIDGFMMQETDFDYEIIIHDDASTDGTREVLLEYKNKYPEKFKLVLQDENQWAKGVRGIFSRFTFPLAKGKYIALCEGDDYWTDPLKLQKQVDFLEESEEYVLTYHNANIIDETGKVINQSKLPDIRKKDFSGLELRETKFILTLTMVFRNCIENYPSNFLNVYNGDIALVSLLGNFGKGKYMDEIKPASYREHDGGVWSKEDVINRKLKSLNTPLELLKFYKKKKDSHLEAYFHQKLTGSLNDLSTSPIPIDIKKKVTKFIFNNISQIGVRNAQYYLRNILLIRKKNV